MYGLSQAPVVRTLEERVALVDIAVPASQILSLPTLTIALIVLIFGLFSYGAWFVVRVNSAYALIEEEIFGAIAGLTPTDAAFPNNVKNILRRIEDAFDLRSVALVVLDRVEWQIQEVYDTTHLKAPLSCQFFDDAIMAVRARGEKGRDILRWRYPNQVVFGAEAGYEGVYKTPCDSFTSIVWFDDELGVMLVGRCLAIIQEHSPVMRTLNRVAKFLAFAIAARTLVEPRTASSDQGSIHNGKDLADRVAHEFNNILTSITGYAEMAADTLSPSSRSYAYVEHIQQAGARAKLVVAQMLNSTARQNNDARVLFDVVSSTAEILSDLKMCMPSSKSICARLPDSPVHIYGDPIELQQVLFNLCKNASDAMHHDGCITLSIAAIEQYVPQLMTHGQLNPGRYVRISIEDTGHGIADADLQRIFTPYFSTKPAEKGTGLGLAIVYQTVCWLNGVIDVRSKLGSGTSFNLFFPEIALSGRSWP